MNAFCMIITSVKCGMIGGWGVTQVTIVRLKMVVTS